MLFRRRRALVCRQAVGLMTDYLDGVLSRRDRERLEAHLADCPHCTEYLAQIKLVARHGRPRRTRRCRTARRSTISSRCIAGGGLD